MHRDFADCYACGAKTWEQHTNTTARAVRSIHSEWHLMQNLRLRSGIWTAKHEWLGHPQVVP